MSTPEPQLKTTPASAGSIGSADETAKLKHALELMTAGREQDQMELKICVQALVRIGSGYDWMTRDDMLKMSAAALCDIGVWSKSHPPNGLHERPGATTKKDMNAK